MNMRTILSLIQITFGMGASAQLLVTATSKPSKPAQGLSKPAQGLSKRTLRHMIAWCTSFWVSKPALALSLRTLRHVIGRGVPLMIIVVLFASTASAQLLDAVALDSMRTFRSLERALTNPDQVYRLDLSGQKLKEVPEGVFQLKNLNALDLSNNKLKELPERLQELRYLQEFRASRNKLTEMPKSFCRLTHLKRLDLSRNALSVLPKCVGAFKELVSLDLWDNDLADFPEEMAEMRALRFLDLRAIQFDEPEMEHLQELMPQVKIFFSQPCNCGM